CSSMCTIDPEYSDLAKRIAISNHHKNTKESFLDVIEMLYSCHSVRGEHSPLVSEELYQIVKERHEYIQEQFDFQRDYLLDYFGFKTLEKSYLLRLQDKDIVERPQHLWMRVAIGLYGSDLKSAFQCYTELSTKCYTHATPTLFNSGTPKNQLASCFLLKMQEDSITGIFNTLGQCAAISKHAGGIGLNVHNIRATGSWIRGTNGTSNGLVPMLRVFNDTARYVDQGGGKRNGSFAIYVEPWHADVMAFLHLKRNHGDELLRARDLFYALWIPDLFMKRVLENGDWTLFNPDAAPGLDDVYGDEFVALYERYEREDRGDKTVKAQLIWTTVMESLVET
ncbi:MAG TPA: ribonucleoside-diphosphate reductase subunit alpha, partial [Flavobacteriales bacterium]|nr:ribonucleoside-diphosphate reductase subunit alpha [Flavobacteriales bacterium]